MRGEVGKYPHLVDPVQGRIRFQPQPHNPHPAGTVQDPGSVLRTIMI